MGQGSSLLFSICNIHVPIRKIGRVGTLGFDKSCINSFGPGTTINLRARILFEARDISPEGNKEPLSEIRRLWDGWMDGRIEGNV